MTAPLREKLYGAIHGGTLSNRISANAVGRRGHFLKRLILPHFEQHRLLRKGTERASSTILWRAVVSSPVTRFAGPTLSVRQAFGLASVPAPEGRNRIPGTGPATASGDIGRISGSQQRPGPRPASPSAIRNRGRLPRR